MTVDVAQFELYLMSRISADEQVGRCLARLGLSHDDMVREAESVQAQLNLRDGCPHDTYHRLLAGCQAHDLDRPLYRAREVSGSKAFFYRLPLWPGTVLQINRHPDGSAWGLTFRQDPSNYQAPRFIEDVTPWSYTIDGLRACFGWYDADEWSDYQHDVYDCHSMGAGMMCAIFDFGLLRKWYPEVPARRTESWTPPLGLLQAESIAGHSDWLRAVHLVEGDTHWYSIEHTKSRTEAIRVEAPQLQGRALKLEFMPRDPLLADDASVRMISSTLLGDLLGNRYQGTVDLAEYTNAVTGKRLVIDCK